MIVRRTLLAGAALVCAAPSTASGALARLVGVHDRLTVSQKFTGAGWYAFGPGDGSGMRVFYASTDQTLTGFINLSDGPQEPTLFSLSMQAFDFACWGACLAVAGGSAVLPGSRTDEVSA